MIKQKQINKAIQWGTVGAMAYFIGSAIAGAIKRKREQSTSGIGAAKRRIFKELSLAQKAGVDFTKKFDELDEDEIKALEKVSSDTGYTETYYKSLKKAYDAVSGIGTTYDVKDADGNTVLTWTDSPSEQAMYDEERDRAFLEARTIEDERMFTNENRARDLEEREKKLAAQRKRLSKAGRSQQMALFGTDFPTYSKQQIDAYVNSHHDLSFMFERANNGKILVGTSDETGGRNFYVGKENYLYLRAYALRNLLPIAIWQGDYWMIRNDKDGVFGCGYTDEVEAELYEIWREQIEYGNTERDYETWREIYGDEFAKRDVLPYI